MSPRQGLAFEMHVPDGARDGATVAVLLHGRGADRHDLVGLAPHLPPGTVLVTPEAPHPGQPWGYGPGWAWYRYVAEDRVVGDTLMDSLARLDAFLDALPAVLPIQPGALVLGGFSQGGTTALAYGLTRPGRADALVVLSGFLVHAPELVPVTADALGGVPVFWGHGRMDPAIPHALGERGRERLRAVGVALTVGDYAAGHGIAAEEMADLSRWLGDLGLAQPPSPAGGTST